MKKFLPLVLVVAAGGIAGFAQQKTTGSGAPSGAHYDLNIIGVDSAKKPPLTGSDRHTIFVPLVSDQGALDTDIASGADILLIQGPFTVCDGNAFDAAYDCSGNKIGNQGAVFQLPCNTNIATATGTTLVPCTSTGAGSVASYQVWARVVGKPGGSGTITTCATDLSTNTVVCNANDTILVRSKLNKFENVTNALTSLVTGTQTVSLFGAGFQNFFWDYDNNGNKLLQLRLYLM
ncbi:MAG TPA: hypothetical protein VFN26_05430 [Candidatus Acidoferrum sp.]|nr:hypothetical protein [Candidatus Acidoferrum sp.]